MDPTRPPKPSRAWIAPVAVGAVALAGAAFGLTRKDPEPTPPPVICEAASDRLSGLWDSDTRAKVGARFVAVQSSEVGSTWRALARDLDRYTMRWSELWTASCKRPDRLACLERAAIALRDVARSLAETDVVAYSKAYKGVTLPALEECESTSVPAP